MPVMQNKMDSLAKRHVDAYKKSFALTEANRRPESIMHEVEVKPCSFAFRREEDGTVLCDIEALLTRNLCECILYFYDEICSIP